jgi:selenide,water dikinase
MTDVTGFGLMGHLLEMCQGSGTQAEVHGEQVQTFDGVQGYHSQGMVPGGARRNFASYGAHLDVPEGYLRDLLCDPQTSGGLLVSVCPNHADEVAEVLAKAGCPHRPVGRMLREEESLKEGVTVAYRPS